MTDARPELIVFLALLAGSASAEPISKAGDVLKNRVFAFGFFPKAAKGERIEACGRYNKAKLHKNGQIYKDEIEAVAVLKGAGIAANKVDIVDDKVVPLVKGAASPQARTIAAPR